MLKYKSEASEDLNQQETSEWLESLDEVIDEAGPDRAAYLLQRLNQRAAEFGVGADQLFELEDRREFFRHWCELAAALAAVGVGGERRQRIDPLRERAAAVQSV